MLHNEHLVIEYLPIVKQVAYKFKNQYDSKIEIDDLIGYGYLGLIDAAQKYNESKNVPFDYYARLRIRGEIIEGLRNNGLHARYNRKKTEDGYKYNLPIYINDLLKKSNKNEEEYIDIESDLSFLDVENKIDYQHLYKALNILSEKEQDMINMYYFQNIPYRKIGLKYGVNESRACQVIMAALKKIKNRFGDKLRVIN